MPSDDRDEPSFVTNVERTIDLEDRSEVGTLPRPPKLFAEDEEAEERVEKTLLLATSEPAPVVSFRPPMHSEIAGQWVAPVPPPGFVPPISSDTAALARNELVASPPHLPTPPPAAPYVPPAAKRRGPGLVVFLGSMLVLGLGLGALAAWKLDVLPHAHAPVSSAAASTPPTAAPPPVEPSAAAPEVPSAAPSASAPPVPSGKHSRPRRPRKGR